MAGYVHYENAGRTPRLIIRLRDIDKEGLVGIAWIPDRVHLAEVIASIRVEHGATVMSTLRFFHAPYYARPGLGVFLTDNSGRSIARARPCRAVPRKRYAGCRRQEFADAHAQWVSPETGENAFVVRLTLVGSTACSLRGYPAVQLLDRAGRALPFDYTPGVGQYISHAPPTWVNLRPGQRVYAEIAKYRCDTTSYQRASTARVGIGLDSVEVAIPANSNFTYCGARDPGSQVEVSRLVRTESSLFPR